MPLSSPARYAAGCRLVDVAGSASATSFTMLVMYPCAGIELEERFGPYSMPVVMNGAVEGTMLPLVVISHGSGGTYLTQRTLARHLARAGYAVAVPEHPGNNRNDNRLADSETILATRPRHVRDAIDWMYADESIGRHLAPDLVGVVGHSLGGYTALALAGGRPIANPKEYGQAPPRAVPVEHDTRVRAIVLLAPATPWLRADGALRGVDVPILMFTGEMDEETAAWHGEIVLGGVADITRVDHRIVTRAGHFAFLSPFPSHMTTPLLPPSMDAPDFDRVRFHDEMYAEIIAFFQRVL